LTSKTAREQKNRGLAFKKNAREITPRDVANSLTHCRAFYHRAVLHKSAVINGGSCAVVNANLCSKNLKMRLLPRLHSLSPREPYIPWTVLAFMPPQKLVLV